ncbi:MAG: hypothetical protein QM576_04375 [Rhodopseudomonas sp.]|uniref:hypothetical protein n=1 Tax=Rhodopseudomonas sp. TaxID=1078 RepID=UPI0039E5F8B1
MATSRTFFAAFAASFLISSGSAYADDLDQIATDIEQSARLVVAAFKTTDVEEIATQRRQLIGMYPRFHAIGSPDDPRLIACSKAHQALLNALYSLDTKSSARGLIAFEEAASVFDDQLVSCKTKRRRARR